MICVILFLFMQQRMAKTEGYCLLHENMLPDAVHNDLSVDDLERDDGLLTLVVIDPECLCFFPELPSVNIKIIILSDDLDQIFDLIYSQSFFQHILLLQVRQYCFNARSLSSKIALPMTAQ